MMPPAQSFRTHEPLDPRLRELYRAATPTQKLATVARINATLLRLKEAELTQREPALSAAERRTRLRRWWFAARD